MTQQTYSFQGANKVAAQASAEIERWLVGKKNTISVLNVEHEASYQARDIDLLLTREKDGALVTYGIEIKADRLAHKTRNFFFETLSNVEKGTPGCFLYSEAEHLYYYLVENRMLYIFDLSRTRAWFLAHKGEFQVRRTSTPVGDRSYETEGCLVPIKRVIAAVPPIAIRRLAPEASVEGPTRLV